MFNHAAFDGHEKVVFHFDAASGLRAIVALHDTYGGRSLGGTRIRAFSSEEDALNDVLKLSRAMTYKIAMADVGFGGAKAVILDDGKDELRHERLKAMGRFVEGLRGSFVTAEDMGMRIDDLRTMRSATRYVLGADEAIGESGPFTAIGVLRGIEAAARYRLGRANLAGLKVAVQGLGHVGYNLCRLLHKAGAALTVTDTSADPIADLRRNVPVEIVSPDAIYDVDADVFAPCAVGGTINKSTIARLRASVVAGGSNNQLGDPADGRLLRERKIAYAPDYVINAGGMLHGVQELLGYDSAAVAKRIDAIFGATLGVLDAAEKWDIATNDAADRLASEKIVARRAAARPVRPIQERRGQQ